MPVAIYTTYVQRRKDEGGAEGSGKNGDPLRHAAYYPLCDYSPELAAIRAAAAIGARPRFIDLTFPEMVESGRHLGEGRAQSLLEERHLAHSEILRETCRRVGARDPDDLWDQLYELDHDHRDTARFFQDVLGYCALARRDYNPAMLQLDGCAAREAAMAAAVAEEAGRVVVVTGGFHTVALPGAAPALPGRVEVDPKDALVTLMRYGFEQLDRLNGYASGMPAPEFYQRTWEEKPVTGLIVELAREARRRNIGVSVADEIAALEQVRRLAALRGPFPAVARGLAGRHPLGVHQGFRRHGGPADSRPGQKAPGRRSGGKRASRGRRSSPGRGLPADRVGAQGRARPDRCPRSFPRPLPQRPRPSAQPVLPPLAVPGCPVRRVGGRARLRDRSAARAHQGSLEVPLESRDRIDAHRAVAVRIDARGSGGRSGARAVRGGRNRGARAAAPMARRGCCWRPAGWACIATPPSCSSARRDWWPRTGRSSRWSGRSSRSWCCTSRASRSKPITWPASSSWPAPPTRGPATCFPVWPGPRSLMKRKYWTH